MIEQLQHRDQIDMTILMGNPTDNLLKQRDNNSIIHSKNHKSYILNFRIRTRQEEIT